MPLTESDAIRIRQFIQRLESGLILGQQVFVTYHDSNLAATPSNPTGDGTTGGWHRLATEASNWMSVKTALKDSVGTWGTPIRVFGLQGTETAGVGQSDDVPKLVQIKFIGDGGSKVGWTAGTVEYGGNSYAIAVKAVGDASTDQFIYWDDAAGQTSFKTTGTLATAIGANHHYVCRNDSGVATPAWIQRIILGGVIQADTMTTSQIQITGKIGNAIAAKDSSLLPNWRLDIEDTNGRPAGIYPNYVITDFSQIDWLDAGKDEIKILSYPDTTAGYGFPAIPIDDKQKYTIVIRHKSSVASTDGLYLVMLQFNTALPATKTHIGASGGTNCEEMTNLVNLVENGAYPGTNWVVNTYTYTPTAGTKYASFVMANYIPDTAGVEYHVDYVLMYPVPKTADEIADGATYGQIPKAWKKSGDVTKIDGGKISTGTVLAAAILTYALTAANATIDNLFVKTAHIDNLNVTTGKLANEATKILVTSFTAGEISKADSCGVDCNVPGDASGIVKSAVITSLGNAIEYTVQFEVTDVGGSCGAVWLTATTVGILKGWPDIALGRYSYTGYTTPGSGAKTFQLRACRIVGGTTIKIIESMIRLEEDLGK